MKALYFICHEDHYGQRTGTYEPMWIDPKDISVNRFGFLTYNGRYVYEWEIDVIRACQMWSKQRAAHSVNADKYIYL